MDIWVAHVNTGINQENKSYNLKMASVAPAMASSPAGKVYKNTIYIMVYNKTI